MEACNRKYDKNLCQVLILSFSFMAIFGAVRSTFMISKTVLESAKSEDSSFGADGYVSLCIFYAVYSVSTWVAPSVVEVFTAKRGMIFGGVIYICYVASYMYPQTWLLYSFSVLIGLAGAILWTSQGTFFTNISTPETVSRNSGIFWAINEGSILLGSGFAYWQFNGKTAIDAKTRTLVFAVLTATGAAGIGGLFCLKSPVKQQFGKPNSLKKSSTKGGDESDTISEKIYSNTSKALSALRESFKLLKTVNMALLCFCFVYFGNISFFSRLYATAIGTTLSFGPEAKALVGSVGIGIGIGEILGGTAVGIIGSRFKRSGRIPLFLFGMVTNWTCFVLIYTILPDESAKGPTFETSLFDPPLAYITYICSFLMGLGDACVQTQFMATLSSLFVHNSSSAYAVNRFIQAIAAASLFFASAYFKFGMICNVVIIMSNSFLATFGFVFVELKTRTNKSEENLNHAENSTYL